MSAQKSQDTRLSSLGRERGLGGKPTLPMCSYEIIKGEVSPHVCVDSPSLVSFNRVIQSGWKRALFGKRRSIWFYLAKERFFVLKDLGVLDQRELDLLVKYFDNWRSHYRRRYVHLEKGDTHVFIKQYSRFDEDYRGALRRKLKLLNFMLWDLKIELTIDPKKFMRLADEFYFINRAWNKLRSWLYQKFGEFEYFKVLEVQKSGRPHFHVLISGIKWIDQEELSSRWSSYGGGKIVYVKRVYGRNRLKMCGYVMKYVNKTLRMSDKVFSSLLFASNRRLFSMSRGCQNMINVGKLPKRKKGFEFAGSVLKTAVIEYCDEKRVEIKAFMVIEASFQDYREFPELFGGDGG